MINFIFWFSLLLGGILILTGRIMLAYPPKKINWIYGYRTPASMKSQERWDFAQIVSSDAMIWVGISTTAFGLIVWALGYEELASIFTIIGWNLLNLLVLYLYTERKINQEFGENEI